MSLAVPNTEQPTLQLVRYEALFKLIDDIQEFDDVATIAEKVATQWKYFANVAAWRLMVPNGKTYMVIDGVRGEALVQNVETISAWDQYHLDLRRPHLLALNGGEDTASVPEHLTGKGVVEIMVLPFTRHNDCVGLLSVASRNAPFSEIDNKFIRIFGKYLTDRIANILQRRQTNLLLIEKATHDALTGLLNRGTILDWLGSKLSLVKRTEAPLSVILIDIDFFKQVNDQYGHLAGDAVLQQMAQCLQEQTRDGDSLGRYGGEEFLVVLSPCDHAAAARAAERFRAAVEQRPFNLPTANGAELNLTISLGSACVEGDLRDTSVSTLLKLADEALYQSKAHGRNCVTAAPSSRRVIDLSVPAGPCDQVTSYGSTMPMGEVSVSFEVSSRSNEISESS